MNTEHYTDNYGKIIPNIQHNIMTTISTETNVNNNADFNVQLNALYNNNKYIIHEMYCDSGTESGKFCGSAYENKIFIDNYGNYYIYSLIERSINHTPTFGILDRRNTDNIFRLSNKLIDFIKSLEFEKISGYNYDINILEHILINFHKIAEYTHNIIKIDE